MVDEVDFRVVKTLVCMSMAREAGALNQPRSSTGSGSQAPMKCHCPSAQASTQAWLSSVWAHLGVYTCRAGMPTDRSAATQKVDSSPQRPSAFIREASGDEVRASDG